ncbi:hypothetical protein [Kitasatospora sp. CB01950]|uniref:hypothetical protein n=1 Tax=Kitasatospora sp. CB01950 TaxID=1703930 RepID=UPI00093D714A|nr:hypothetical protein [Kitasatospora sp. CB01950]OKI99889.1 hypothetical protein AMK19_30660 [Kitasatospora sp. CB01950]
MSLRPKARPVGLLVAAAATAGLLATAAPAQAATAGCGNNGADYTGAKFTVATSSSDTQSIPAEVTFNGDGSVVTDLASGTFTVVSSTLAEGGSGAVRVGLPNNQTFFLRPTCLAGTTVRQLDGLLQWGTDLYSAVLSRPSL